MNIAIEGELGTQKLQHLEITAEDLGTPDWQSRYKDVELSPTKV